MASVRTRARLTKNKIASLKSKNPEIKLTEEQAQDISNEIVQGAIDGFNEELNRSPQSIKNLSAQLKGIIEEFFKGMKEGVDSELKKYVVASTKIQEKALQQIVDKQTYDRKDLMTTGEERKPESEFATPVKNESSFTPTKETIERSDKGVKEILAGKNKVKDFFTIMLGTAVGAEDYAKEIVSNRTKEAIYTKTEQQKRPGEFVGMSQKEIEKKLREEYREKVKELQVKETMEKVGYKDISNKQDTKELQVKETMEKVVQSINEKELKNPQTTVSVSKQEETAEETRQINERAADESEKQTSLLTEIRDLLKMSPKTTGTLPTAAAATTAGTGMPEIDIDLPRSPIRSLKNIGKRIGSGVRNIASRGMALASSPLGVAAGAGLVMGGSAIYLMNKEVEDARARGGDAEAERVAKQHTKMIQGAGDPDGAMSREILDVDQDKAKRENELLQKAPWYTRAFGIGRTEFLEKANANKTNVPGVNVKTDAGSSAIEQLSVGSYPEQPTLVDAKTGEIKRLSDVLSNSSTKNREMFRGETLKDFFTTNNFGNQEISSTQLVDRENSSLEKQREFNSLNASLVNTSSEKERALALYGKESTTNNASEKLSVLVNNFGLNESEFKENNSQYNVEKINQVYDKLITSNTKEKNTVGLKEIMGTNSSGQERYWLSSKFSNVVSGGDKTTNLMRSMFFGGDNKSYTFNSAGETSNYTNPLVQKSSSVFDNDTFLNKEVSPSILKEAGEKKLLPTNVVNSTDSSAMMQSVPPIVNVAPPIVNVPPQSSTVLPPPFSNNVRNAEPSMNRYINSKFAF